MPRGGICVWSVVGEVALLVGVRAIHVHNLVDAAGFLYVSEERGVETECAACGRAWSEYIDALSDVIYWKFWA